MKLQHLKRNACPTCNARIVSEAQKSQHTNGEWFESQAFSCGCVIEYIPNFSREEVKTPCPKSKREQEKHAKREAALKKAHKYISRLDVDEEYKETLLRGLPGFYYVSRVLASFGL